MSFGKEASFDGSIAENDVRPHERFTDVGFVLCVMKLSGGLILKNICSYIVCSKRLFYLFVNKIFFLCYRTFASNCSNWFIRYCFFFFFPFGLSKQINTQERKKICLYVT